MSNQHWKERYAYLSALREYLAARWELIVLGLLALLAAAIWPLPQWMVQHEYWEWKQHPNEYAKLVDDYRKTIVQIIGGAFLLYTLYLTQRRTRATEETLRTTKESLKVATETQVTDRFTKAITQLGAKDSQGNKQLEIRFGGIYSLERIAKDSPGDHWAIMEILTAYVRENSPGPKTPLAAIRETDRAREDTQAIMTVIGRRNGMHDRDRLDLSQTNLRWLNLRGANLRKANLFASDLSDANLTKANLEKSLLLNARLSGAHLAKANLMHANLEGAHLEEANLSEANLKDANLSGARLYQANLKEAILYQARLQGASLMRAQLQGADLSSAEVYQEQVNEANGDHTTKLPPGLTHPDSWPKGADDNDSTASENPLQD